MSDNGNKRTVWVVYADKRKDFSKAEVYGELKDVFSTLGRIYNTKNLIEHARHVLSKAQDGDYLLMVGDPALCGICTTVMAEKTNPVNLLRWDREQLQYTPLSLNFEWED